MLERALKAQVPGIAAVLKEVKGSAERVCWALRRRPPRRPQGDKGRPPPPVSLSLPLLCFPQISTPGVVDPTGPFCFL